MKKSTLWEAVCQLSGPNGESEVVLDEALERCAVTREIAHVELKRLAEEKLVETVDGFERFRLTERGRSSCMGLYHTGIMHTGPEI
jgi:hypothetical protein